MENQPKTSFRDTLKSKFVRSIIIRMTLIFLIVMGAIIAIVFVTFSSEINDRIEMERKMQLNSIEETISDRMSEVISIAYSIGEDSAFYYESIEEDAHSGYEMAKILERYLVGNDFIEHLAYYRLSEPDTIYVSSGERSLTDFFVADLGLDKETAKYSISEIKKTKHTTVLPLDFGSIDKSFFSCVCPLPISSQNPQAFVLMLIPFSRVEEILATQLVSCSGKIVIFDEYGNELYDVNNIDKNIDVDADMKEKRISIDGKKYIVQKSVSESNQWTYVSVIRINDILSAVVRKQVVFIVLVIVIMIMAIISIVIYVMKQYAPINRLALMLSDNDRNRRDIIDEQSVLIDSVITLKDDSEQKQKFEAAYNEANAASKAKSVFFSNMSHDIRTPMNAIIGMTDIASKHLDDPSYVSECLDKVKSASKYLLDIINNVLDLSRIEAGKFNLSINKINLPEMVRSLINILNQSLDAKKIQLSIEIINVQNENVLGDKMRINQVFMNILSNAIKFTPENGHIWITVRQDNMGTYSFIFKDNGIGMSKAFLDKVFDTFSRDETVAVSKIEGTGLGMSIAKNIVDLMGGTITCQSEINLGTTFEVTLDLETCSDKNEEMINDYHNVSVLIVGLDEITCHNQELIFKEFTNKVEWHLPDDNLEKVKIKPKYVIVNHEEGFDGIAYVKQMKTKMKDVTYIFVTRNILSIDQSTAVDEGISWITSIPLFKSTAKEILDKKFDKQIEYSPRKTVNLEGLNVLLVEDHNVNKEIAHILIKASKASVIDASNGKEAVEIFQNSPIGSIDVILMDIKMPIMNGYEATKIIRSLPREDALSVSIYAVTANTLEDDIRQVMEVGMDGHLSKPYNVDELYGIMQICYNKKQK